MSSVDCNCARQCIVLADSTKIGRTTFVSQSALTDLDTLNNYDNAPIKFIESHHGQSITVIVVETLSLEAPMPLPTWLYDLFKVEKPVIAMAHIPALPGTPRYDRSGGVEALIHHVRYDVEHLYEGGVDAIMFCNEDDRPYVFEAGIEQIAAMTRVVTELKPANQPFGIDFLWDPMAAMAVAMATGASFIREVLTGVYESDMGLWSPNAGRVARFRRHIDADGVHMFYNVVPEFASPLGTRSPAQRARNAVVSSLADGILVSGSMAGEEPDLSTLREVKEAVGEEMPVFLNTGARAENIETYLKVADGVIVGSSLKVAGYTWNPVDPERVARFMERVHRARQNTDGQ